MLTENLPRMMWDSLSETGTGVGLTAQAEGNVVMSGESLYRLLDGFADTHAACNSQSLPRDQMACFGAR